jgi:hypothetical protein
MIKNPLISRDVKGAVDRTLLRAIRNPNSKKNGYAR